MTPEPLFILDGPHYHAVKPGAPATFAGVALATGPDRVVDVIARAAGEEIGRARPDGASPELAWVPLEGSAACRFSMELAVPSSAPIEISVRAASGEESAVFRYDVPFAVREAARLSALCARVAALPSPGPALVATTQGLGDVEAYRASIVGSFLAMESLLRAAGADPARVRNVLDIGCGTGRLLLGWHADDASRRLAGTDLNAELIAWACANLARAAAWEVNGLEPPLPHADGSFDLVLLSSVLTHLSLASQKAWLAETHRLLAPGGRALVTLHGDLYARIFLRGADAARFAGTGYAEVAAAAEGANAYTSFHSEACARSLVTGFTSAAFFPRGVTGDVAHEFPVASLQDVYVLAR
jgi:SAM-dependent methyltransferase